MDKRDKLRAALAEYGSLAVAFSGGADSSVLLYEAAAALGRENVLAITAHTVLNTEDEIAAAREFAKKLGVAHEIVKLDQLRDENVRRNDVNRCYYCKKLIFTRVLELASEKGFKTVADGTNADDANVYRPGRRALAELGIASPIRECGITKQELRAIARADGLPDVASRPARPCLATRLPYGRTIDAETLAMIEAGEREIAKTGVRDYRLRHHDSPDGAIARIEVPKKDFGAIIADETLPERLAAAGYRHITLDLRGFRSGSFDETLTENKK